MIMLSFRMNVFAGIKYVCCIDVDIYNVYRQVQKSISGISFSYVGYLVQTVSDKVWFY